MAFAAILVGALALMQHSRGEDIAWVQASGGEVMVADGYAYHIFYSNGTFDVVEGGNIECLIVAGGGQGGRRYDKGGAGGGAGGLIHQTDYAVTSGQSIQVTVGQGGAGSSPRGMSGENSVFGDLTAIGGGGGAAGASGGGTTSHSGIDGGSGGGASESGKPGSGTDGQGFAGGSYTGGGRPGGGGGASGIGGNSSQLAIGGAGLFFEQFSFEGSPAGWFAGGGAGGDGWDGVGGHTGGLGGGGNSGVAAISHTGGGGGGGQVGTSAGQAGGSGIVIVRYPQKPVLVSASGGDVTEDDDYIYHTFKTNGLLEVLGGGVVEYLVVAGGGSGGGGLHGGGGGAGGLLHGTMIIEAHSYPVVVGEGGRGNSSGENSTFAGLTAFGGGRGAVSSGGSAYTGGSGGGGGYWHPQGASGTTNQGYQGGSGGEWGGGGGGASEVGNADGQGAGGDGFQFSQFTNAGYPPGWYAGGGAGSRYNASPSGAGGLGGGGEGATPSILATAGAPNTGGGGGGNDRYSGVTDGGSGIVIVRYPKGGTLSILGRVTDVFSGQGVEGVTLSFSNAVSPGVAETITDSSGCYTQAVAPGWSGTVIPAHLRGGVFTPPTRSYENMITAQVGQDYQWKSPDPVVAGRIVNAETGEGVDGVTVTASGNGGSCISSNGGVYKLMMPEEWSGTVTPSYHLGSFEPAGHTYPVLTLDQLDRDFAWVVPGVTISGCVTNEYTAAGVDGVQVDFADGGDPAEVVGSNTVLMLRFNGVHGESAVKDASASGHAVALTGAPKLTSAQKKFGNASLSLNGASYLTVAHDYGFDLGGGDFTIDLWARFTAIQARNPLIGLGDGSYDGRTTGWLLTVDGNQLTLSRHDGSATVAKSVSWTPSANTWYHIAAVRSGDALRFYVNGVQVGADQDVSGQTYSRAGAEPLHVGGNYWDATGSQYHFNGHLDEVRLSPGVARWSGAFTPPDGAYLNDGASKLLLHADGEMDASDGRRIVNTQGDAALSTSWEKYGTGSLCLDGIGDYVEIADSADFDFGDGDFTVDWWEYRTAATEGASSFVRDDRNPEPLLLGCYSGGMLYVLMSSGTGWDIANLQSMGTATLNQWVHLAVSRRGNTFYAFKNGQQTATWSSSAALAEGNAAPKIGGRHGTLFMTGYMDEFRITKGQALWTANFTPPGAEARKAVQGAGGEVTSGGGNYSREVSYWWSGTALVSYASGTITPVSRSYAAEGGTQTDQNYSWRPPDPVIDGYVRDQATDLGLDGVDVVFSGGAGTVTTDGSGHYSNVVVYGWSGSVTPSFSQGSFAPSSNSYVNVTEDASNQDFAWIAPGMSVTGIEPDSGATVGGEIVTISGAGFYGSGGKRTVAIENPSGANLTNYQVRVELDTQSLIGAGRMRADAGDLRVYSHPEGALLSHWIEPDTINTTNTAVWVKVPIIPGYGSSSLSLDYGKPNATSLADGTATFDFFDDFSNVNIDTQKWSIVNATGWSLSDGELRGANTSGRLTSKAQFSSGSTLEILSRLVTAPVNGVMIGGFYMNTSDSIGFMWNPFSDYFRYNGYWGPIGSPISSGEYLLRISSVEAARVSYEIVSMASGAAIKSGSFASVVSNEVLALGQRYDDGCTDQSYEVYWDWVRVRPYVANEPTVVVGDEVNQTLTVTFGGVDATGVQVVDEYTITAVTPAHGAGVVDVVVSNSAGQVETLTNGFTYIAYPDPVVSGRVIHQYTGAGVDGITIAISGGGGTVETAEGGYYSVPLTYGGTWTLTPTHGVGAFTPESQSYTDLKTDRTEQNYTWTPPDPRMSGRVVHQVTGAGVDGVTIQFSDGGGSATTAGGGYFTNTLPFGWSGSLTPLYGGLGSFEPAMCSYSDVVADVTGQGLVWTPPNRTILGRITDQGTGEGLDGVTVVFSDGVSTETVGGGHYSRAVYHGWSGTATPQTARGSYSPASRSYSNVTEDQSGQDYAWIAPWTISGRVTQQDTGEGEDGVTLSFSNGGGSTITAGGGYYEQEVVHGWSGRATPSYGSDTFTPAYQDYSNVTADQANQDYAWAPPYLAGDRYVSLTGLNKYPYTNWSMAAKDIQTAIHATRSGDNVWVADGTYEVTGVITGQVAMTIRSVNGAEWTRVRRISGNTGLFSLSGSGVVLDGFTLEGGHLSASEGAEGLAGGATLNNGAVIRNCIIRGNTNQTASRAGGLWLDNNAQAINCLIVGNDGGAEDGSAGGVRLERGSRLINCTVYGNVKSGGTGIGGVCQAEAGPVYVDNSIVWNNVHAGGGTSANLAASDTLHVRHSCYADAAGIQTPVSSTTADPLFADAPGGNFRLQASSPGINTGNDSYNSLLVDLEGSARKSQTIDMGPYEFFHTVAPTLRGRVVHQFTGAGVDGVVLVFGNEGGTATTAGGGFYSNTVAYNWTGRATPGYALGTFSPTCRDYTDLVVDQNNQNYTWNPPLRRITGRITHSDTGAGVSGVTLTFSNGGGSTTTSSNGDYTNLVYYGWSGSATLSFGSGSFSPFTRTYANVVEEQAGQDYQWIAPLREIAGRVTDQETGAGVDGVTLTLSGGAGSAMSSGGGYYSLSVPDGWSGTLTPTSASGSFSLAFRSYSSVVSDQTGQNFLWIRPRTLSGRVTNQDTGEGMDGVTLTLNDGGTKTVITSGGGYYTISATYGWTGTLTPSYGSGSFTPANRSFSNLSSDSSGQDFAWIAPLAISGRIVRQDDGTGVDGVTVSLNDNGVKTTVSSGGGYYTLMVRHGWGGSVSLAYGSGSFTPAGRSYSSVTVAQADQDYAWIAPVAVSGRITHQDTGAGVDGVSVSFSKGGGSATTAGGGFFSRNVVHGWSGSLTPSHGSGSFSPASRSLKSVTTPPASQDFVWLPPRVIAGRITDANTGEGIDGVPLSFSGGGGSATTAGGGYYSRPVVQGWSGRATPSTASGSFVPTYRDYDSVSADLNGQDYSWRPPTGLHDRFVSHEGSSLSPYTNWATAARDIQTALSAARPGETVWVAAGEYDAPAQIVISKAVRLESVEGAAATAIRRSGTEHYGVLRVNHAAAVVSGFTLRDGSVTDNSGAGVDVTSGYVVNSILSDNEGFGAVLAADPNARIANVLVVGNQAGIDGGGVVINCTIYDNTVPDVSANLVYNSIVEGSITATEIAYTLADQVYPGPGNLMGNPYFVDPVSGDYRLQASSPCRDMGNNYYNTLYTDLDGQPRVYAEIDLGPYERPPVQGLAITLSDSPDPVSVGDALEYVLLAHNAGPNSAQGVVVSNQMPSQVGYLSHAGDGSYHAGTGLWTIGDLANGASASLTLRMQTLGPGIVTGQVWISATAADPGETGYDRSQAETTILVPPMITNVVAGSSSSQVTVQWAGIAGMGYDVYSSDEPFAATMGWVRCAGYLAAEEARQFIDNDLLDGVDRRFYQVTYAGGSPPNDHVWGVIRLPLSATGYSMISPPLCIDRRFNGTLGAALAEVLTGNNDGIGAGGDGVYIYQGDDSWRTLYLDAAGTWRESTGNPSEYALPAGQGFWVRRAAGSPVNVTFSGTVGNAGTQTLTLQTGFNLLGLSEGKELLLKQTLATAEPQGGAWAESADHLVTQRADGSWRFLMFVTNWGAPYDGCWFDLGMGQVVNDEELAPGAAYYYLRRGEATEVKF